MSTLGFIILRHVRDEKTDKFWKRCYLSIREYYKENKIIIIDDNSDKKYVTNLPQEPRELTIIYSEFPGRGELLPYYYYSIHKWFDKAVFLHDSTIIKKYINFTTDAYKPLWSFEHIADQIKDETAMIKIFNDRKLISFYENKKLWKGIFGGMCIIDHSFLVQVNNKYEFKKLLDLVKTRYNRCSFERVLATILAYEHGQANSQLGDIHKYCKWGLLYSDVNSMSSIRLPIFKYWTGR